MVGFLALIKSKKSLHDLDPESASIKHVVRTYLVIAKLHFQTENRKDALMRKSGASAILLSISI